jgi:hypothetical protein
MKTGPGGKRCDERITHRKIKLSGSQTSTLYLLNPREQEVERIEVDGCAITAGLRCDWLVCAEKDGLREEIFVELKGSDINHAIQQIEATIPQLSSDPTQGRKRCLVALTRNPLSGTDINKHQIRLKKHYNARFLPVRDGAEVSL